MVLHRGMGGFLRMRRNALRAGNVNEGAVVRRVRLVGNGANGFQFCRWIEKAFVAAWYIVIHFHAEDVPLLGVANDGVRVVPMKTIGADADAVRPILIGPAMEREGQQHGGKYQHRAEKSLAWPPHGSA
ncbi:MAG: hypothetical protein C5B58_12100 [Acidobacteria bacterium]|nr:MAG: hypothetical protein C5B58_12100 [Acidobacteriota bacterium]